MAMVSFALNGGVIGTLVVLGLIAGFNMLVLGGIISSRRNPPASATARLSRRDDHCQEIALPFSPTAPRRQRKRDGPETANPEQSTPQGYDCRADRGRSR